MATGAFHDDIEARRDAERRGELQHGASLVNIFDSAIELGRLIAQVDRGTFQYALAWCGAPVLHGSLPALTSAFHADWSINSSCFAPILRDYHYICLTCASKLFAMLFPWLSCVAV